MALSTVSVLSLLLTEATWPTTVAGWVALITGIGSFLGLVLALGVVLQQMREGVRQLMDLRSMVGAVKLTVDRLEDDFVVVKHTLWGPRGDDGIAMDMKLFKTRIAEIEDRNRVKDAIESRGRNNDYRGEERRAHLRREEDRIIRGEGE